MIPLFTVIAQGAIWLAIYFVSTFVTDSPTVAQDSIGGIATFMTYMGMIMFAIIMGGMISMFASRGMVSIGRINEVLKTDPAMKFDENAKTKNFLVLLNLTMFHSHILMMKNQHSKILALK